MHSGGIPTDITHVPCHRPCCLSHGRDLMQWWERFKSVETLYSHWEKGLTHSLLVLGALALQKWILALLLKNVSSQIILSWFGTSGQLWVAHLGEKLDMLSSFSKELSFVLRKDAGKQPFACQSGHSKLSTSCHLNPPVLQPMKKWEQENPLNTQRCYREKGINICSTFRC